MEAVTLDQIVWSIVPEARSQIREFPPEAHSNYGEMLNTFKLTICAFVNAKQDCSGSGLGISCLGGYGDGGKLLKVRIALPGRGKRGSLRVVVAAFCEAKEVVTLSADMRKEL